MKDLEYKKINEFKLIKEKYETHDIYILEKKDIEKLMNRLNKLYTIIQSDSNHPKEFSKQKLELEKIKKQLSFFKLSLNENEFNKIKDYVTANNPFYPYVSCVDAMKIYSSETGLKIYEEENFLEKTLYI